MSAEMHDTKAFQRENRSIAQLIRDFTRESTALVQDEVDLAKAEVSEKISQLGSGLRNLGMGALVLFAGLLVLLDAAVAGLLMVIPLEQAWAAPLIVGGVVALIGLIMLLSGRNKVRAPNLKPQQTLDEVRRDRRLFRRNNT
ncbi:MAG: phage holin family protein [Thiogranum sp.]|nr:phage holin family protein [Thiogranum sp.]